MASKKSLFDKMKANPRDNWKISDVKKLCKEFGLILIPPNVGSHYKIRSPILDGMLTIPARRPIKPIYIRHLVGLCEAHMTYSQQEKEGK